MLGLGSGLGLAHGYLYLAGELTGGRDGHGLHAGARSSPGGQEPLDRRQEERHGLPRPGARLSDQVHALQREGLESGVVCQEEPARVLVLLSSMQESVWVDRADACLFEVL